MGAHLIVSPHTALAPGNAGDALEDDHPSGTAEAPAQMAAPVLQKGIYLLACCSLACQPGGERDARHGEARSDHHGGPPAGPVMATIRWNDTLRASGYEGIAVPVWISDTPDGGYIVVDRSDRVLRRYGARGAAAGAIGGAGSGPEKFGQLLGGGILGDTIFGYDFVDRRLTFFAADGRAYRLLTLPAPPEAPMPASVRPVDDSLLLAVGFVAGATDRPLVRLLRPDGAEVTRAFDRAGFFEPLGARLAERTAVIADASDGIVYAALLGGDSLFAYDYSGKRIAAAPIPGVDGSPIPSFRDIMLRNGGSALHADGTVAMDGVDVVRSIVAVNRHHVIVQTAPITYAGRAGLDPFASGRLLTMSRHGDGSLILSTSTDIDGTALIGRRRDGRPLVARFVGADGASLALGTVLLASTTHPPTASARNP